MAQLGGAPIICAFRERVTARPGETIRIAPDPALVHLFDAGTGQRCMLSTELQDQIEGDNRE